MLTIGADADLVHPGAADEARRRGWLRAGATFDFARAFGAGFCRAATGGELRRACTRPAAATARGPRDDMAALRSHEGATPPTGWRMVMPCAHAAGLPTRSAARPWAAMVSELRAREARHQP